jgi:trehalose utilization protein
VAVASVDDAECGLGDAALAAADVLVWWGHHRHDDVPDEVAARVQAAVLRGLGLVVLHSAVMSKPFRRLMGTTCTFRWREPGDSELVWVVDPAHPIAHGLPPVIDLPAHEMYGEPFDIPAPEEVVLISSFSGGEVFRSGCCFRRGAGRIFSFSPGHETNAVYDRPEVRRVLANAVGWAAQPEVRRADDPAPHHASKGWFQDVR